MMEVKCPYCESLVNSPASANAKIADGFNILLIACPYCKKFLGAVADPVQPPPGAPSRCVAKGEE